MKAYRTAALAVAACSAGLSLAACSGGVTTAGSSAPASSSSPATSAPAASSLSSSAPATSVSASTGGSGAGPGGTVSIGGSIGSFPIPPGATVVDNVTSGSEHDIVLGSVKPAAVASFYASALPQAGYAIQSNTIGSTGSISGSEIQFTGHGIKGQIGAASGLGLGTLTGGSDVIGITLNPQ